MPSVASAMILAVDVVLLYSLVAAHAHHVSATFVISLAHGKANSLRMLLPSLSQLSLLARLTNDTARACRVQKYIESLTAKTKPKKILVCMFYYPDEANVPSWANAALGALRYNSNPAKVQMLIRKLFDEATRYVVFYV